MLIILAILDWLNIFPISLKMKWHLAPSLNKNSTYLCEEEIRKIEYRLPMLIEVLSEM